MILCQDGYSMSGKVAKRQTNILMYVQNDSSGKELRKEKQKGTDNDSRKANGFYLNVFFAKQNGSNGK